MINNCVQKASDPVATRESHRNGFLEYAPRKSKESIPYIYKAKALKLILEQKTKKPKGILKLDEIKSSCYEAAGVSVKANNFLSEEGLNEILLEFTACPNPTTAKPPFTFETPRAMSCPIIRSRPPKCLDKPQNHRWATELFGQFNKMKYLCMVLHGSDCGGFPMPQRAKMCG